MLAEGVVLQNRYRIIRQLGQGGMGAVYEAVDQRLDTTVALKETLFSEERLRKQFEREARLLARLHHPALPRVSDHFAEDDGQFLVMQFIAGDDLAEMIARRRGAFPPEQILPWADQLLDALDYLHTQDPQIIHRDIKPQNLKLTNRGQIVLLDFGLAKGQLGDLSVATTNASIFGYTPNYAPLEQVQGLGTDARSDLYALGATLYHLLTGVKPPDALTRAAAIVNGQPDPLQLANQVNPAIDAGTAAALQRAMSQNRDQRFSSAQQMRNALRSSAPTQSASKTEAATVLFPPGLGSASTALPGASTRPGATAVGGAQTTPVASMPEEVTVIPPTGPPKNGVRVAGWSIAAVLAVVLASVGGYYSYQHRGGAESAGPALPSNPNPAPSAVTSDPSANPARIERVENEKGEREKSGPKKDETARKDEKTELPKPPQVAPKPPAETRNGEKPSNQAGDTHSAKSAAVDPAHSGDNQYPGPQGGRGGQKGGMVTGPDGSRIRTMPDGTRIVTTPNGTRIVTFPDGTSRVFAPGQPPLQRKRP